MGAIQDSFDERNPAPPAPPAPATTQSAAPSSIQSSFDDKNPAPKTPDTDLETMNPWDKPADVPWRDYIYAQTRHLGSALGNAAEDVGKVYADDATFGAGTAGLAASQGQNTDDYRKEVEAARQRVGASRYSIDAMAYLTSPLRWVGTGAKAEQLAQAGIDRVAPGLTAKVAKRVGDFVEGATYTGAQSAGHGEGPEATAESAAGGGLFSTALGAVAQEAAPWAKWIREKVYGSSEADPATIAAGPPPGSPPRTLEQAQDANQMNLWNSQTKYGMPPGQADVRGYASKTYGDDPSKWPAPLRDIYNAAGEEGGPSTLKRVAMQMGTNAVAAGGQYLGVGVDPTISAILHPAVTAATDAVMPFLGRSFSPNPVKGALSDAYPSLTGWRPSPDTPSWR